MSWGGTYFVKKWDSYQIFRIRKKILWEPGSQVPNHYPTLPICNIPYSWESCLGQEIGLSAELSGFGEAST